MGVLRKTVKFSVFVEALMLFGVVLLSLNLFVFSPSDCRTANRAYGYKFYLASLFGKYIDIPVANNDDKCFYEFYEGIYEASRILGSDVKQLDRICERINKEYEVKSWDQCYFRLGIAMGYTQRDKISDLEQMQRFMDDRVSYCEKMPLGKLNCLVGFYTGINIGYQNTNKDGGYPTKEGDPFWVCKTGRGSNYRLQCYRNMVSILHTVTGESIPKSVGIIKRDLEDSFERFEVLLTYYSSFAYTEGVSYVDMYMTCKKITDKSERYACIEGYATGIDEVAKNGSEGPEVVKFCLNSPFNFDEKGECLRRGFFELPTTWDVSIKNSECRRLSPKVFWGYCDVEKSIPVSAYPKL